MINKTIPLSGPISTYSENDIYPTHFSNNGKGGYHTVKSILDRDNIPNNMREVGMIVYDGTNIWVLKDGIENDKFINLKQFFHDSDLVVTLASNTAPNIEKYHKEVTIFWLDTSVNILKVYDRKKSKWVNIRSDVASLDCGEIKNNGSWVLFKPAHADYQTIQGLQHSNRKINENEVVYSTDTHELFIGNKNNLDNPKLISNLHIDPVGGLDSVINRLMFETSTGIMSVGTGTRWMNVRSSVDNISLLYNASNQLTVNDLDFGTF